MGKVNTQLNVQSGEVGCCVTDWICDDCCKSVDMRKKAPNASVAEERSELSHLMASHFLEQLNCIKLNGYKFRKDIMASFQQLLSFNSPDEVDFKSQMKLYENYISKEWSKHETCFGKFVAPGHKAVVYYNKSKCNHSCVEELFAMKMDNENLRKELHFYKNSSVQ